MPILGILYLHIGTPLVRLSFMTEQGGFDVFGENA